MRKCREFTDFKTSPDLKVDDVRIPRVRRFENKLSSLLNDVILCDSNLLIRNYENLL